MTPPDKNTRNSDIPNLSTNGPPLLKTCVMCRTRKVKCGGEKPSCTNCVRHRCECIYRPSVRHLRGRQKQTSRAIALSQAASSSPSKPAVITVDTSTGALLQQHLQSQSPKKRRAPSNCDLEFGDTSKATTTSTLSLSSSSGTATCASISPSTLFTSRNDTNMSTCTSQSWELCTPTQLSTQIPIPVSSNSHAPQGQSIRNHVSSPLLQNISKTTFSPYGSGKKLEQTQLLSPLILGTNTSFGSDNIELGNNAKSPITNSIMLPHSSGSVLNSQDEGNPDFRKGINLSSLCTQKRGDPHKSTAQEKNGIQTVSPILESKRALGSAACLSQRWRTLPPLTGKADSLNKGQNVGLSYGLDDGQLSIHDILGSPPLTSPIESHDKNSRSSHTDRAEANCSFGGSSSSTGTSSTISSPLLSGMNSKQLGASLAPLIPDSMENMIKSYFKYQYPSSGVVHEGFFWYRYHHNMLTPLIIYSMLAVATWNLASDESIDKYGNLHEIFYKHAKQYVEDAMDEAHLRSIQGLLVLADYETISGRWGSMWNHTTMARRLTEGIIFRDTDFPWVGAQYKVFDFEFQRVQRAYWHSLINDIWASVLMDKSTGGFEIRLPPKPTYDFTYRGIKILHSDEPPGYRIELGADALQDPQHGTTAAVGDLYVLVGKINNMVYSFVHAGNAPPFESFIDYEMRLTNWYLDLPENVQLDDRTILRFTSTLQRADLGEVLYIHMFWNFARMHLMKMGLVLSLKEDPMLLRNIYDTRAFYNTDSRALQFYQSSMPILTPDKAASYDEWLFHFCRCMCLQSAQNLINLLKLGEKYNVHPGHYGAGIHLPLIQVISVSLGLVHSPDSQVVQIAVDHLTTSIRTLLKLKHWFNTSHLLLHLFLSMQDPALTLPKPSYISAEDSRIKDASEKIKVFKAIEVSCPFPPSHLITELLRRLNITFEELVKETIRAVRVFSPARGRVDPCISSLLKHLPEAAHISSAPSNQEPEWFKYAPAYLRSAWKRLIRTYSSAISKPAESGVMNLSN